MQVKLETLLENNISQIEEEITIQRFRSCIQPNCDGLETTTISDTDMYLCLLCKITRIIYRVRH